MVVVGVVVVGAKEGENEDGVGEEVGEQLDDEEEAEGPVFLLGEVMGVDGK
jgi:hypothetical protein